jgi:hypothetical protein
MKEINYNKGENQKNIKTNIQTDTKTNTKKQTALWLAYGRVSSYQQVKD